MFKVGAASAHSRSKTTSQLFQRNKKEFLRKYLTIDETWIHYFTPESNWQSAEWTATGESPLKRPETQTLEGNDLASVFWDAQGILFIDYLEKGRIIYNKYYIALMVRLTEEIAKRRTEMKKKKCSFTKTMHRVTNRSQRWQNYMNCISNCFRTHSILQIWPPNNYWMFADLKRMLKRKRFGSNEVVI